MWDTIANLDFKLSFTMSFYAIQVHSRPVPEFRPDLVLVSKIPGVAGHAVWPPPARARSGRQQRRPRRQPPGDGVGEQHQDEAVLDGASDAGGDDLGQDHESRGPELLHDALAGEEPDEAEILADFLDEPADDLFAEIDGSLDRTPSGARRTRNDRMIHGLLQPPKVLSLWNYSESRDSALEIGKCFQHAHFSWGGHCTGLGT